MLPRSARARLPLARVRRQPSDLAVSSTRRLLRTASAAASSKALLELLLQPFGRYVVIANLGLGRRRGRHVPRLEVNHVDVIENVLAVRPLVRLALRQRIRAFATVKKTHPPIIAPNRGLTHSGRLHAELTDADRLYAAACKVGPRLCSVLEGARFERRPGYTWTVCPQVPIPSFNSVWPEEDSCAALLADAISEIVALGLPYSIQMRRDRTPLCEEAAEAMGLMPVEEIPAMAATADELSNVDASELEVIHVATRDELAQALAVSADGFAAPPELLAPLYDLEVAGLEGLRYYLGRVGSQDVTTAIGFTVREAVGIFNVATLPEHRGRGYGAAITAQAAFEGFRSGAQFAWLQANTLSHSVYRRIGFRDVETYVLWTAPEAVAEAPEGLV